MKSLYIDALPLKHLILEYYNKGYWGIMFGIGTYAMKFPFHKWDLLCSSISPSIFDTITFISYDNYFRFSTEPIYKISGKFLKTELY